MKQYYWHSFCKISSFASQFPLKVGVFDSWLDEFKWRKKLNWGLPGVRSLENLYGWDFVLSQEQPGYLPKPALNNILSLCILNNLYDFHRIMLLLSGSISVAYNHIIDVLNYPFSQCQQITPLPYTDEWDLFALKFLLCELDLLIPFCSG